MSKLPAAEQLRQARESRAQAQARFDTVSAKLGTADWKEDADGAAFAAEKRSISDADMLIDRLVDTAEIQARSFDHPGESAPCVSVNVLTKRTKDSDLPGRFSLVRAIRMRHGIRDLDGRMEKTDGIEAEMLQEGEREARSAEISDFDPNGFMVPQMCAYRSTNPNSENEKRDLTVGTTTAGGFLVETVNGPLIGFLDPNTPLISLGARALTGLRGNLTFPRQSARATGYPVAEQGALTESQPVLQQMSLSPKRQGAYTEFSLQLLRQGSPDVEMWLRDDLRTVLATLQELYAIQGTGAGNQPTGILSTSGIGSVVGGVNGIIPTWAHWVALETAVSAANALGGRAGYLSTPQVVGVSKQAKRDVAGNGFIWEGMNNGGGMVNGYKAEASTLVPGNLTKGASIGIAHAIIFSGRWQDLVLAYWGGVEIVIDPYTLATTGTYRITANAFMDVGVRHPAAFAAMLDALVA